MKTSELLRGIQREMPQVSNDVIVLGRDASDTRGNAWETARWMRKEGFGSLRLVTGNYHMPRAQAEFQRAMPGVAITPEPVFPEKFRQGSWGMFPGTATLTISEYHKYIAVVLRHIATNFNKTPAGEE